MKEYEATRKILLDHYHKYPDLQIEDIFKFLHQSALGCEHLIQSPSSAAAYIQAEASECIPCSKNGVEPLDGNYCRVHLACLGKGLSADTLGKLLFLSAVHEEDGLQRLKQKLEVARSLVAKGSLPFSLTSFSDALRSWEECGYPALHHSESFRLAYRPSYRVIKNEYATFLPLFTEIDRRLPSGPITIAIEGSSASGKSTVASLLQKLYDCTVFHMDDFFLRPEQRTPERFSEPGGNVDRERFLSEILLPLSMNKTVRYRRFDCSEGALMPPIQIEPKRLVIVEGAYSMHPELAKYYDYSVFLDISPELQRERIKKRNPESQDRFFNEWIPLERTYFEKTNVIKRCQLRIPIG